MGKRKMKKIQLVTMCLLTTYMSPCMGGVKAEDSFVRKGTQTGAGSLAVGEHSEANGLIATAVGYGKALDTYTIAMGRQCKSRAGQCHCYWNIGRSGTYG